MNEQWLTRISRLTAWLSSLIVLLFVISGYGMTKGIVDPDWSRWLHERCLPLPLFVTMVVHSAIGARNTLRRWRVFENSRLLDVYVAVLATVVLGFLVWLYGSAE